jgi:hypothetical protein
MKLNELHGYKQYQTKTLAEIINTFIKKYGIKISNGAFAFVVIPKDKNYVYKIWTKDDGYEAFLKYLETAKSDHLPKVGKIRLLPFFFKRDEAISGDLKIVRIEKLDHLTGDLKNQMNDGLSSFNHIIEIISDYTGIDSLISKIESSTVSKIIKNKVTCLSWISKNKKLAEDLLKLAKFISEEYPGKVLTDFVGNIMLRGSTPVIIDPFYTILTDITVVDILFNDIPKELLTGTERSGK